MSDSIDTSQGVSVGDAVLRFLGDTTQLDQAMDRVATAAETKMAAAADSVSQVGDAVDGVSDRMAVGAQGAVKLGDITTLAGEKTRASMYEARGEVQLLGEMFGITLPRHVRSFVAEIPGVGAALSGAFAATAVLFLIEALTKGAEKIQEWAEKSQKIADAWDTYNQTIYTASTSMQKEIDGLQQKFIEMTQGPVAGLDFALKHLEKTAFQTFAHIEKDVADAVKAMEEASSSLVGIQFNVFKDSSKDLDKFKNSLRNVMREATQAHPEDPFAAYNAGIAAVQQKERDLTALIKQRTAASGDDSSAAVDGLHAERQAVNDMLPLLRQGIDLQEKKDKDLKQSRTAAYAEQEAKAAHEALEKQLADIKAFTEAQHAAHIRGEIDAAEWLAAQVRATDAAAIAQEHYQRQLVAIYRQAGEAQRANAEQAKLDVLVENDKTEAAKKFNDAMDKQRAATLKVREEWDRLMQASVEKDFAATAKSVEQLTRAEEELSKAQTKLAEDKLSQYYKDQEAAITKLAEMHLITEEQKDDRLALLEQQQSNAAIAILAAQLDKEKAIVDAAQAKVTAAKSNPFFTPAQVADLEVNLAKAETAVTNTESQIVQTKEKFNKQSEANDKSHYGRALLLAMAYGAEMLAEQLKQNHGDLLAAENQLKQAKARGDNTDAIHRQIEALKLHEKELEKEANGNKAVIVAEQKVTQVKLLVAEAILKEGTARGLDTTAIEKEIRDLQLLLKQQQLEVTQLPKMTTAMHGLEQTTQQLGGMMQKAGEQMDQAFAKALMGALQSGKSIGAALEAATKQVLDNLAEQAMAQAIYCTAMGIAELATGVTSSSAAEWFAAAAEFGLVAGVAGGIGMAIPGAGGGSSGGQTGPTPGQTQNANVGGSSGGGPVGVTKLATGGVVNRKIMIGDSPSGGDASEAILPLSDPNAMRQIASALAPQGQPQPTPQEEARYDPQGIDRMLEAISALTGMRQATNEPGRNFTFAPPATGAAPGFQFSGSTASGKRDFSSSSATVGEALGFPDRAPSSPSEKAAFSFASPAGQSQSPEFEKSPATVGEALGFDASPSSAQTPMPEFQSSASTATQENRGFSAAGPSSPSPAPSFASSAGTVGEALGFTSAAPSSGEKPQFSRSEGSGSEASGDFRFSAAGAAASPVTAATPPAPTVGERLGFDTAAPSARVAPGFSSEEPSASEKAGFAFAALASTQAPAIEKPQAQTVGEALGFTSAPASATEKPSFERNTPSASAAQGYQFAGTSTVGEALGFDRAPATPTPVTPATSSNTPTVGEALGFTSAEPSPIEKRNYDRGPATPSDKPSFDAAPKSASQSAGLMFAKSAPSTREAAGFTSGEPAPGEKPSFDFSEPTESEKAQFLASQPSVSAKPGFETATSSPTVGEALGFKFDTPYPGDKPVFSSGQPSAPEKPGFSLAAPSANEQRDFTAASPKTVGEALGFDFSAPRTSYEGLGFTSGQPSGSATRGFSSGVPSPHDKPALDFEPSTPGERPSFNYSAPSIPREMPDMEALAANFGGLLSISTLRAASNSQVPAAAVSAGAQAVTPMDLEARLEKFAARLGSQITPEGRSSSQEAGGGGPTINVHVKGMISSDNLNKVVKKINRAVANRQTTLNASNSLRVTRRSQ